MDMVEMNESVLCLADGTRTVLPAGILASSAFDDIVSKVNSWALKKGLKLQGELCILY